MSATLLKVLRGTLMVLGGIFLLILAGLAYVYFADPFQLRSVAVPPDSAEPAPRAATEPSNSMTENEAGTPTSVSDSSGPELTPGQENALRLIGIDPTTLPSEITEAERACFDRTIGEARVTEIIAGDTPTAVELFVARECLN